MINKITNWCMSLLNGGSEGEVAVDTKLPQDYCSQDNPVEGVNFSEDRYIKNGKTNPVVFDRIDSKKVTVTDNTIPPDVSEPVLSFVDTVLRDPKRFVINIFNMERDFIAYHNYSDKTRKYIYCQDKEANLYYGVKFIRYLIQLGNYEYTVVTEVEAHSEVLTDGTELVDITFLTKDELEYINNKLITPMYSRYTELMSLKTLRKERNEVRRVKALRKKLTEIYKGD